MKVIVINDDDGHTTAFKYTEDNIIKLLAEIRKSDMGQDINEDFEPRDLQDILDCLEENCYELNSRGGKVHILDIEPELETLYL